MQAIKRFLNRFQAVRDLDLRIRGPKWRPGNLDLQDIENLRIPINENFLAAASHADRIEGMLSPFSMAVMDMLFSVQEGLGAKGDILEIGTYRGKSAALLGSRIRAGEKLTLVDIEDYLDRTSIAPFATEVDCIFAASSELRRALSNYSNRRGTFRFIHIDASHGYEETFHELCMADELLGSCGIIAMDDFANLNFSQNIAAIFKYLHTARTNLMLLLVTVDKGYLCRKRDFNLFADRILKTSIAEMRSRDVNATLARTSYGPEYRAFHLREGGDKEQGFYGPAIYRNQIIGL